MSQGRYPNTFSGSLGRYTFVRKNDNTQNVNNSTTLENDDALFLPVGVNRNYIFELFGYYISLMSADIKMAFSVPTNATGRYSELGSNGLTTTNSTVASVSGSNT